MDKSTKEVTKRGRDRHYGKLVTSGSSIIEIYNNSTNGGQSIQDFNCFD